MPRSTRKRICRVLNMLRDKRLQNPRQPSIAGHELWPDDISIADETIFDHGFLISPKQITHVDLLALAVRHGGRLVTFDRGVPLEAVRGAKPEQLVVL